MDATWTAFMAGIPPEDLGMAPEGARASNRRYRNWIEKDDSVENEKRVRRGRFYASCLDLQHFVGDCYCLRPAGFAGGDEGHQGSFAGQRPLAQDDLR